MQSPTGPTYIDYRWGNGRVLATMQTVEWGYAGLWLNRPELLRNEIRFAQDCWPPQPPSVPLPDVSPQTPRHPLKSANLSTQHTNIYPTQTSSGQPVTITTNVVNTGDEGGNYNLTLKINGQVEQTKMVSVGPQGTQPVKFTVTRNEPGTYTVDIGGQRGNFTVLGTANAAGTHAGGGLIAIFGMVALIIAAGVVLMLILRRPA